MNDEAAPVGQSDGETSVARMMLRHRQLFVAPMLAHGPCVDADGDLAVEAAAPMVTALAARPASERLADLSALLRRVTPGGTLAVAATEAAGPLHDALAASFVRVSRWRQRAVAGSILAQERFAGARIIPLADAEAADVSACTVFVCSAGPLMPLLGGLYESGAAASAFDAQPTPVTALPAGDMDEHIELRSRAASLVDRLASLDADRLAVFLDRRSPHGRSAGRPWHDPPSSHKPWPLHEDRRADVIIAHPYDRRTDDDFVAVARDGEVFRRRFGLDAERADFDGAVDALNALRHTVPDNPAASIVIPVHGQLGYTLNCLHALFLLSDRTPAEIILIDDASDDPTPTYLPRVAAIRYDRQDDNRGFIWACNTGASRARADLIVLLNNDTRVLPGWLDRLAESFALFPRAGIVGSKLLYPDGSLQEAGGIIWRGGEAWNYGRGDDPNRPYYCYARQVDYASGASVAIPRHVWDALGGLDAHFAPAYYEDTDLFFRARAAGWETWMQPGSRAIHYEGMTSGTDTGFGVKAYQIINGRKFFARHRAALLSHQPLGESPVLARDRVRRRRALVIEATCPTPKEDAGSLYTLMVLRVLVDLGWSPTFVPQDNFLYQPGNTDTLLRMGVECVHAPYDDDFDAFIKRQGALYDLVVVFRARVLEQVHAALRRYAAHAPILFDVCDLEFLRLQRAAELSGDIVARVEAQAVKRREIATMTQADCILSPSSYEVDLIARELPDASVLALPLMVDVVGTQAGAAERRDICFLGGYAHPPNVDAVTYFVREIMPIIREAEPGTRFIIAGANPVAAVLALAGPDVVVTGFVDDLAPLFDGVRVCVSPLRYGAGMKGKILTAMAHGLPVVTTSVGIEGIAAEDEVDVIVADTSTAIAAACLRVLRDDALWNTLSQGGLRLVGSEYSHESGRATLQRAIDLAFERWTLMAPLTGASRETDAPEQAAPDVARGFG